MTNDPFSKWWACPKKHYKRRTFWLPELKKAHAAVTDRQFRYFTLCARPMIDIYMLVKEKILPYDKKNRRVEGAYFCECVEDIVGEMRELVGAEEAGVCGFLEDLVLFEDSKQSEGFQSESEISKYLMREGESLDDNFISKLKSKRAHLNFKGLFPFDFINLDYCDPYYGRPPNVLRIHAAIEKILLWQTGQGVLPDGEDYSLDSFVVAITAKTDSMMDDLARDRLIEIVESNCAAHPEYREAIKKLGRSDAGKWIKADSLDFFMSIWPKEIARLANSMNWEIAIKSHSFYERKDNAGQSYHMICLVAEFSRANVCSSYIPEAIRCLKVEERQKIPSFDLADSKGKDLIADLREIVSLRNQQAKHHGVFELPDPLAEIQRLRALNVTI